MSGYPVNQEKFHSVLARRIVLIVKNVFASAVFLAVGLASHVQAVDDVSETTFRDGEYVGSEKLPNLSPEEPGTKWFHENRLIVRNGEAIVDKVPVSTHHGRKVYEAADGGFLTYRARFVRKDGQSFVAMRLFQSEYVMFSKDKRDVYREIKTYPARFVSGHIEIDGVRYRRTVLEKTTLDRLLHLLGTEPLEKK